MIKNDIDLESLRQMLGHEDLATTGIYSMMNTEEALERIRSKSIKFYNESSMFKSSKPCDIANGLKGIDDIVPPFYGVRTWNQSFLTKIRHFITYARGKVRGRQDR